MREVGTDHVKGPQILPETQMSTRSCQLSQVPFLNSVSHLSNGIIAILPPLTVISIKKVAVEHCLQQASTNTRLMSVLTLDREEN